MYLFDSIDCQYEQPFVWFIVTGKAIYEVATMVQRNQLSKMNLKSRGNTLLVCFLNLERFDFDSYKEYFLYLNPYKYGKNMQIDLSFTVDDYVSKLWRMPIDNITQSTWNLLYPPLCTKAHKLILLNANNSDLRPHKYKKICLDEDFIYYSNSEHPNYLSDQDDSDITSPVDLASNTESSNYDLNSDAISNADSGLDSGSDLDYDLDVYVNMNFSEEQTNDSYW